MTVDQALLSKLYEESQNQLVIDAKYLDIKRIKKAITENQN